MAQNLSLKIDQVDELFEPSPSKPKETAAAPISEPSAQNQVIDHQAENLLLNPSKQTKTVPSKNQPAKAARKLPARKKAFRRRAAYKKEKSLSLISKRAVNLRQIIDHTDPTNVYKEGKSPLPIVQPQIHVIQPPKAAVAFKEAPKQVISRTPGSISKVFLNQKPNMPRNILNSVPIVVDDFLPPTYITRSQMPKVSEYIDLSDV